MTNRQMINGLRKALRTLSMAQLATALGYRSTNAVALWLKEERVPNLAILKVETYLEKRKKNGNS